MRLISVDVFGSQIASLGLDEGVPLGEEGDSPHEVTAPSREDEG